MGEPVRVRELLGHLPGLNEWLAEARVVAAWPTIAGAAALRSRAEGVEQGLLQVAVDSSGWLHRLTLEESRLLALCREIAPIRGIRFRLAPARGSVAPEVEGEVGS